MCFLNIFCLNYVYFYFLISNENFYYCINIDLLYLNKIGDIGIKYLGLGLSKLITLISFYILLLYSMLLQDLIINNFYFKKN